MTLRGSILLGVVLTVIGAVLATSLWQVGTTAQDPSGPSADDERTVAQAEALGVLHDWDRRRAAAWARGDRSALAELYTEDSASGAADVAMLRQYAARGLVVRGMRTQVLSADVRSRSESRIVLAVTDRVVRAAAVGPGVRFTLPRDRASGHTIELVRVGPTWRVREVR
ncbi:hypothetical protein [Nocardioides sp.]|uniref:hypothetical protein n=1 Tax=Nocardioides sp. TaxID=35761 RepID=UPI003D14A562